MNPLLWMLAFLGKSPITGITLWHTLWWSDSSACIAGFASSGW